MSSGAMQSNVGNPQVYNDGDQRNLTREEKKSQQEQQAFRFEAGQPNSHQLFDSKDERSLGNRRDAELEAERKESMREKAAADEDPRAPAMRHGNEPSRGAEIDAELKAEEEELLKKKGAL